MTWPPINLSCRISACKKKRAAIAGRPCDLSVSEWLIRQPEESGGVGGRQVRVRTGCAGNGNVRPGHVRCTLEAERGIGPRENNICPVQHRLIQRNGRYASYCHRNQGAVRAANIIRDRVADGGEARESARRCEEHIRSAD